MKNRIVDILKILICFVFFFSIGNVSNLILKMFNLSTNTLSNKGVVICQFVVSLIIFILVLCLYYKKYKDDYINFKKDIKKNITYIIKMFVIFMLIKYLISILSVFILMIFGYDTTSMTSVNQELIEAYVKASPILMLISTAILAPFYEEGIFRLGMKKVIKNKWLFIIISGLIFGLLHIFPLDEGITLAIGLIQSITYVTMGMVLGYVYYKTDNIYMSIGLHFLNNFLSVLVMIKLF